ncbi:MAG: PRC and DUF2382 domain-containing protein [Actinomycetota bacterium]|nr:PRC and DUF2382 domain-containing protein [Actinomycetota bacterium]
MADKDTILSWRGQTMYDANGDKLGKVEEIYLDNETDQPEWATVKTGLFGSSLSFVPIAEATDDGGQVRVSYDKDTVKAAPQVDPDGELSQEEEAQLYRHYGKEYSEARSESGLPEGDTDTGYSELDYETEDRGTAGEDARDRESDEAMTVSEERLRVGKQRRDAGRARLRKYVETDQVTETVPVEREEIRVHREPVSEDAAEGATISEEEQEVALQEERPVIEKQTVPKERIRVGKETVRDEETVSDEVRRERVDVDDDSDRR